MFAPSPSRAAPSAFAVKPRASRGLVASVGPVSLRTSGAPRGSWSWALRASMPPPRCGLLRVTAPLFAAWGGIMSWQVPASTATRRVFEAAHRRGTGRRAAQFGRRRPNWPGRTNHPRGCRPRLVRPGHAPPGEDAGGTAPRLPRAGTRGRRLARQQSSARSRKVGHSLFDAYLLTKQGHVGSVGPLVE
jgi:hypothetical protein